MSEEIDARTGILPEKPKAKPGPKPKAAAEQAEETPVEKRPATLEECNRRLIEEFKARNKAK